MKLLITGGTGVLGRTGSPLLRKAGHEIDRRDRGGLDLFDPVSVRRSVEGADAIMHLATHIPRPEAQGDPAAWRENDRLRSEATPILVDAALEAPAAEREVARFAQAGRHGVVLRLGLLYGPGTGSDAPAERFASYGATLRVEDAGSALATSLEVPSGTYNVGRDSERVSNRGLKEVSRWRPEH